jgi:hypothetical protein
VSARGLCDAHYGRWRRHGNPLAGGTFRGDAPHFLETVVLTHIGDECLIWPFDRGDKGYAKIRLDGKPKFVSRVVCEHAHGPAPTATHEAAHSCGNGSDGCVSPQHLSWKTRTENEADKLIHGTLTHGERNGCAKLSERDIREILALRGKALQREIAERFGIRQSQVSHIHTGKSWGHLAYDSNSQAIEHMRQLAEEHQ